MTRLLWDQVGEKVYETGVDRGVLYIPDNAGAYVNGYAWNGLTTVTESPSGAESNPQYADNIKYIDLTSAEIFGATVEAFTYPDQFAQCDGTALVNAIGVGQQTRKSFGLAYRTLKGNDVTGTAYGYKLHLVYGATAAPSEKAYGTVNDSPEAVTFSWDVTTTPAPVGTINSVDYKPTSILTIDSTKVVAANLTALENLIYGTAGVDPRLPPPAEVIGLFAGSLTTVTSITAPTATSAGVITIPTTTGVDYLIDGAVVTGTYTIVGIGNSKIVVARAKPNYTLASNLDDDWQFTKTT